ncbi:unnamed protein product, partial [marine sediment metagenome]
SKPILEMIILPYALVPLSWILITPENSFLVPFIWLLDGFLFAGMFVATVNLLYGYVPTDARQPGYYACWSAMVNMGMGIGPFLGYLILDRLRGMEPVYLLGHGFVDIHFVFLGAALFILIPYLFISKVPDTKAVTPLYVFGQIIRGNPFRYAFNHYIFQSSKKEKSRRRAVKMMGLSKSPMAVSSLKDALRDVSPLVRKQAVIGLGDTHAPEATEPLIHEFENPDSELRVEAVRSLGKIHTAKSVNALVKALDDSDIQVRNAATLALGTVGGKNVKEELYL